VADAATLTDFLNVLDHTVGSPLEMVLRLTIEGGFVYFGWKLWKILRSIRWSPKPMLNGLISRKVIAQAGWRVFLVNAPVLIPVDLGKALVCGIVAGFYLDDRWLARTEEPPRLTQ
jgi:hypothetical protein